MEKYLDGVENAGKEAGQEVIRADHKFIEKEHMLIGICKNRCNPLMNLSKDCGIDLAKLQEKLLTDSGGGHNQSADKLLFALFREKLLGVFGVGHKRHDNSVLHRSPECKNVFNRAEALAGARNPISCLHFLSAILEKPGDTISKALDVGKLQKYIRKFTPTCTNQKCKGGPRVSFLETVAQGTTRYKQELTQTRAGKFEMMILAGVWPFSFILYFILEYLLPKGFMEKLPHMLHGAVICANILFFGVVERYYVIQKLKKGGDISKVITHVLINLFIFSALIYGGYIAYLRFIVLSH